MSELNDPRVFFAAERTLLAWNRTSLSLIAFGFVIERIGIFIDLLALDEDTAFQRNFSFWIGIVFVLLGSFTSAYSCLLYRKVLRTLKPVEIPEGYHVNSGVVVNLLVAILGVVLAMYLLV